MRSGTRVTRAGRPLHGPEEDRDLAGERILVRLIQRAKEGDREAFTGLIRVHRPSVQRVALRLVGNHEDAEDIAQEVFVRAWRGLERLAPGEALASRFASWLYTITVRQCRDLMRRRGRRPEHAAARLLLEGSDLGGSVVSKERGPCEVGVRREVAATIETAVAALPERLRVAFVLRALEGLDYGEVGEITGVRPATVRTQMVQARRALRRMLSRFVDGGEGDVRNA